MRATIRDVAKASNVSTGTVSRVLNNRSGVKAETREKVLKAVNALGFVPESAARDLSLRKSLTIGIHLASGTMHLAPFSVLFFQGVMRQTMRIGARVIDLPSRSDGLPQLNVDGVILLGAHHGDPRILYLETNKIPYVLLGHHIGKSWVVPDDIDGGRQVARYFTECGHSEFLFVTQRLDFQSNVDRLKGFSEFLETQSINLTRDRILTGYDTPLTAYRNFIRYIEENSSTLKTISAIFACSDEIACGVKAALEDRGFKVPDDISIVGFDDMPELGRGLTTVRQDINLISDIALKELIAQIEGKDPTCTVVPVQLILRNSSGLYLGKK